jgi:hypothetical protein
MSKVLAKVKIEFEVTEELLKERNVEALFNSSSIEQREEYLMDYIVDHIAMGIDLYEKVEFNLEETEI